MLFVLAMTIEKMFPLNRPEIFFVTARTEQNTLIQVAQMQPTEKFADTYMQAFVMEYLRARNEIVNSIALMRQKWADNGPVAMWSDAAVYQNFKKTDMYHAIMNDYPEISFSCPIEIGSVKKFKANEYTVNVAYYCKYSDGQTARKNYTIRVGLTVAPTPQIEWRERFDNPLGIKVSQYVIESGDGDPLDTAYRA